MIQTVIFDLDGTLLDTEKYYFAKWKEAMAHFGYHMTDEEAYSVRSLGMPYAPEHFKKLYGEDFDYDKVHTYRRKLTDQVLDEGPIEAKPGAEELLKYLRKKGVRTAIATAGGVERSSSLLRRVGLYDYLDHIVSARQVAHGKPAPDVYLYACSQLHVQPQECYAVEDSPNGIHSAYSAGCKVFYGAGSDTAGCRTGEIYIQKSGITCSTKGVFLNFFLQSLELCDKTDYKRNVHQGCTTENA